MGRRPKFPWHEHKDLCYKLYVEEGKGVTEIAHYFAEHHTVDVDQLPCPRSLTRQLRSWGFPENNKKLTPDEEAIASARIQELWSQNVAQKDIKQILASEGLELKTYSFMKIWKKMGLRLRYDRGYREPGLAEKRKRSVSSQVEESPVPESEAGLEPVTTDIHDQSDAGIDQHEQSLATSPPVEHATTRAQRLLEIQAESDQKLAARKRRRRIRGYGHLPPDAPGSAPRYNSETTLDESKAYLHLSNDMYMTVRKEFQAICEEMNISKKTLCAEGVWEQAKHRLIIQNTHLSAVMHLLQPEQEKKALALDCICLDVTKRMRMADRALSVAGANNVLGITPVESKDIRRSFYDILASDRFESRLVCGEQHWQDLRRRWYDANFILQQAVQQGDARKNKAVDVLCSDTMKRFREDRKRAGGLALAQQSANYGPGPGPAWAAARAHKSKAVQETQPTAHHGKARAALGGGDRPSQSNVNLTGTISHATSDIVFDFVELDPALEASDTFIVTPTPRPTPAFFRLAGGCQIPASHPKLWLGILDGVNMASVRRAATSKGDGLSVVKVHGLVKSPHATDSSCQIDFDDELEAYLEAAGEKPTFLVTLHRNDY